MCYNYTIERGSKMSTEKEVVYKITEEYRDGNTLLYNKVTWFNDDWESIENMEYYITFRASSKPSHPTKTWSKEEIELKRRKKICLYNEDELTVIETVNGEYYAIIDPFNDPGEPFGETISESLADELFKLD